MISDEDLMIRSSQGDTKAFEQLVLRHQSSVWRFACHYIRNTEEARDITQKVFLKLFEASSNYRRTASFKTYLFRIINNTCLDFLRKKRPVIYDKLPEIPDTSPSQTDIMVLDEQDKNLRLAIGKLPAKQKSAVVLRYNAELSIREMAEILRITEKAAEQLLARARSNLHSILLKNEKNQRGIY